MVVSDTLEELLAAALPEDVKTRIYHITTPSTSCEAILASPPGVADQATSCESQFLGIASEDDGSDSSVFVYAIEVLIFTTSNLSTIFVSKADSSGFLSRLKTPKNAPAVVQSLTRVFLDYLLTSRLGLTPVVLSLFARSQNQYLFPGSVENTEKHVLDDRQLIKWWCKVLDAVWRPHDQRISIRQICHKVQAHVVVPGCDMGETRLFFPASSKADLPAHPKWHSTYPLKFIAGSDSLPPRCSIPRLPDDPKSRFLDDLDGDYVGPAGQWRSVKSLSQFWEMMSFRQECHAGRLVGFIWVTFQQQDVDAVGGETCIADAVKVTQSCSCTLSTSNQSFSNATDGDHDMSHGTTLQESALQGPELPPPSSPVRVSEQLRQVSALHSANDGGNRKVAKNASTQAVALDGPKSVEGPLLPTTNFSTKGEVEMSSEKYEELMDYLLELDFSGYKMAAQSTKDWFAKVLELGKITGFGRCVVGMKPVAPVSAAPKSEGSGHVNFLTGVRKKRKPEAEVPATNMNVDTSQPQTNLLAAGLVRKKPKA